MSRYVLELETSNADGGGGVEITIRDARGERELDRCYGDDLADALAETVGAIEDLEALS